MQSFDISYTESVLKVACLSQHEYFAYGIFNVSNNFSHISGRVFNLF